MIPNSETGVRNKSIGVFQLKGIMLNLLLKEVRRYPLWYLVLKTLMNRIGYGYYFDPLPYWHYLVYLAVILAERLIVSLILLGKLKQIETLWSKKDMHRLKLYNNQYMWRQVQIFNLKVGDMVKLTEGTISPVDLLIIDTSHSRYSEKIAYTNENKITGKSRVVIKNSVKNMNDLRITFDKDKTEDEKLKEVMMSMNGFVEYDPPNMNKYKVKGIMKLKNDPKVTLFDNSNVMFSGSKLHSEWLIGMVLYNGKNAKILNKNLKASGSLGGMISKNDNVMLQKLNNVTLWMVGIALLVGAVIFFMLNMSEGHLEIVKLIENTAMGYNGFRKLCSILSITLLDMPYYLILFLDISNIISVLALKHIGILYSLPKFCQRSDNQKLGKKFGHTITRLREGFTSIFSPSNSNNSKQPTTVMDTTLNLQTVDHRQNFTHQHEDESRHMTINRRSKGPSDDEGGSYRFRSDRERNSVRTSSNNTLGSSPQVRISGILPQEDIIDKDATVQTHNLDSLSILGNIGEVIFDKTDVLTFGRLTLRQIATRNRDYQFDGQGFVAGMVDFRNNPELYNQDDSDDIDSQQEDEEYSEKMQEYQKELNCEYDPMLMDSDEEENNLHKIMTQLDYPKYLADSKTGMLFEQAENFGSAVKPDSKISNSKEDLSSFCNLLKISQDKVGSRYNFSARNLELPKRQQSSEKMQKAMDRSVNNSPKVANGGKQAFDIVSSGLLISQKVVSSKNISNQSKAVSKIDEEDMSSDSLDHILKGKAAEDLEPIKINFAKDCGIKAFISDLANRKHQLDELVNYLYLFQECGSLIEHRKVKRKGKKETIKTAVSSIFNEFGYKFKSSGKRDTQDAAAMINQDLKPKSLVFTSKISSEFGVVSNFIVKLVNDFTNQRKRMSMIVCDTERSTDSHYLIVNGEEKYMRPCLRFSKRNRNQYKMLVSRYKSQGLKPIVIGIKVLQKDAVEEYMNSFISILKTSRDQIENLENLAISMETDLAYFGMVGVADEVRPEAKELCNSLKNTGIGMNMFSGDSLERCLHVVKKLKFTSTDFSRSGEYIHLNFKNEDRANIDIKRIFDNIYNTLKQNDIAEKSLIKLKSDTKDKSDRKEMIKSWLKSLKSNSSLEIMEHMDELQMSVPKTPMLISGPAVGVIMKSPHLTRCLQAISILSDCIILHSAQPAHSIFMIDILKRKNNAAVLAIGDGFNYFGIMRKADVSIQISHPDVPLIFGDFLVSNLRVATHLLFYNSFHVFKANLTIILIEVWRCLPYAIIASVYLLFSEFSGILTSKYHLLTFYLSACGQVLLSGAFNSPYKRAMIKNMQSFYIENKFSDQYTTRILVFIIISSILEAMYMIVIIITFTSQVLAREGQNSASMELVQDFVFLGVIVVGAFKHTFLTLRRIYMSIVLNIVVLLAVGLSMYFESTRRDSDLLAKVPVQVIFKDLRLGTYFAFFILVPIYANFCLSLVLKSHFLSPFCRAINKSKESNHSFIDFLAEVAAIRVKLVRTIFEFSIDEYISKIKQCFQRNTGYAPITKIAFIDSFTNKVGLSHLTNSIHDDGVAKRFRTVQMRIEKKSSRRIVATFLVLTLVLYWTVIGNQDSPNLGFDTVMMYNFVVGLAPLLILCIRRNYQFAYQGLTISMAVLVAISVAFVFGRQENSYGGPRFELSRLLFSSIPIDYKTALFLGTICDITSYIK